MVGIRIILVGLCLGLADGHLAMAQDQWPRFRGPNGAGVAEDAQLPTQWTADDYSWTVDLPGSGSSSPVIWDQHLFVTSCEPSTARIFVQCLDLSSGRENWRTELKSMPYSVHRRNSFASSTAAVDQDFLYVTYANPDHTYLLALDHEGREVWRRDFGRWVSMHGFGTSPMIHNQSVILVNSQQAERLRGNTQPGQTSVIAVDRQTGQDRWSTQFATTIADYSVPCVWPGGSDGRDQIIGCSSAEGFFSLDPETGERNWTLDVFQQRSVASPVLAGDLVLGSNGSGGGGNYLVAARMKAGKAEKVYEVSQSANYVPTPVVVNGLAFLFSDRGIASCIDVQTGQLKWRQRVAKGFSGSPVATASHVYVMDETGNVVVVETDGNFKLVCTVPLGQPSRATPAISGNRIFFRTDSRLFCLAGGSVDQ